MAPVVYQRPCQVLFQLLAFATSTTAMTVLYPVKCVLLPALLALAGIQGKDARRLQERFRLGPRLLLRAALDHHGEGLLCRNPLLLLATLGSFAATCFAYAWPIVCGWPRDAGYSSLSHLGPLWWLFVLAWLPFLFSSVIFMVRHQRCGRLGARWPFGWGRDSSARVGKVGGGVQRKRKMPPPSLLHPSSRCRRRLLTSRPSARRRRSWRSQICTSARCSHPHLNSLLSSSMPRRRVVMQLCSCAAVL